MKTILAIIVLIGAVPALGQIVKLEPSNPAPRVGDSFSISFILEKNDPDSLEVADDVMAKLLVTSMNRVGDGNIEISEWFLSDPGPLKIGPLQIPINGNKYITNVLDITVSPKLPEDIDEGIWIRQLNFQGEEYIILEQRWPERMRSKTNENGRTTYSMSTADGKWTELNIDKIQRKGIEIEKKGSRASIQPTAIGDALYMVTVYTYKPLPSFKGRLTIDKTLLIYVPEKGHFEVRRVEN